MAANSPVLLWNLTVPAGSLQQWNAALTDQTTGAPYPITGATWEYVARISATDTGTPLISVTTTANAQGVLAVTASASLSQVQITLNPAATASLAPGNYTHALWMNPGTTAAFCWFSGQLVIQGVPQP